MRYLNTFGLLVLAIALWNPGKSTAQQAPAASYVQDHDRHDGDHDRDHRYSRDREPEGSYRETCENVNVSGDRLNAKCKKRNGGWRNTSLNHFDRCRGEIVNDNGRLECR